MIHALRHEGFDLQIASGSRSRCLARRTHPRRQIVLAEVTKGRRVAGTGGALLLNHHERFANRFRPATLVFQTGGDDGDAHLIAHALVEDGAEDDFSFVGDVVTDGGHDFIHFAHLQRLRGGDVDQHALGASQFDTFQQRASDSLLGGQTGTIQAFGNGRTHHGTTHGTHDGAHVFEVDVDQTLEGDDLGNTAHGVTQHIVGGLEAGFHFSVVTQHVHQTVVENHDQRIDMLFQLGDTDLSGLHALTFKTERLGHDGDA